MHARRRSPLGAALRAPRGLARDLCALPAAMDASSVRERFSADRTLLDMCCATAVEAPGRARRAVVHLLATAATSGRPATRGSVIARLARLATDARLALTLRPRQAATTVATEQRPGHQPSASALCRLAGLAAWRHQTEQKVRRRVLPAGSVTPQNVHSRITCSQGMRKARRLGTTGLPCLGDQPRPYVCRAVSDRRGRT